MLILSQYKTIFLIQLDMFLVILFLLFVFRYNSKVFFQALMSLFEYKLKYLMFIKWL